MLCRISRSDERWCRERRLRSALRPSERNTSWSCWTQSVSLDHPHPPLFCYACVCVYISFCTLSVSLDRPHSPSFCFACVCVYISAPCSHPQASLSLQISAMRLFLLFLFFPACASDVAPGCNAKHEFPASYPTLIFHVCAFQRKERTFLSTTLVTSGGTCARGLTSSPPRALTPRPSRSSASLV
jgi:hypothetical protein